MEISPNASAQVDDVIRRSSAVSSRSTVCVFGASLDVGNRGVRALGVSLAGLMKRTLPGAEVAFHYANKTGGLREITVSGSVASVTVRNCRMSPRSVLSESLPVILVLALLYRIGFHGPARRNDWLRSLIDAKFIGDIRGGDSFSDIYGFRRFFFGCLPLLTVQILGRPYAMLPQTYGPFRSRSARVLASVVLRNAAEIMTRDRTNVATVLKLCGREPRFCPDVAFTLEARKPDKLRIYPEPFEIDDQKCLVGVNVSGLLYMGGYTGDNMFGLRHDYRSLVDSLIDNILASSDATILLIPHVFGSEREEEACRVIQQSLESRYPGRVFSLASALNESEVKWVIGRTDFFVGSRMHACIAALSQCVPAVGLAYSAKFLGVFQSAGVADTVVDLRSADVSEVVQTTLGALKQRSDIKGRLEAQIPAIRCEINRAFETLVERSSSRDAVPA